MKVTALAQRSGDWWAIEVPEVDGVFTQAKRLDQVPEMVADAVAMLEDVDPTTIEVEVVPTIPADLREHLELAKVQRAKADDLNVEASALIRRVAITLNREGYSMRDIGVVLGVSHQRVAQLLGAMTIKEAGDAATRGTNRTSKTMKSGTKVRELRGAQPANRSVTKKSRAAAALSQTPKRKGSSLAAAARTTRQPKA